MNGVAEKGISNCLMVYVTTSTPDEARKIADKAVESKLAACANILPGMESVYSWKNEIQHDRECVLILKTTDSCMSALTECIKSVHSYEVPCVVALPIESGSNEFLAWIRASVKPDYE